jgi:hypothetical protein
MPVPTVITDLSTTASSNFPSGAETIGTSLDDYMRAYQAVIRTEYNKTVVSQIPCGRLTLTSGTAVTTSDVTAAETVYYTPYKGNTIALFDGTNWKQYTFTEKSIDVPDATQVQDVFIYDNAGTLTLELTTWTNDTTRATALTTQDGILVKTGALTRRYLGTFYSTTAGNGQTEDSIAKRYLWNYYHRVSRPMRVAEATDTWTYTIATLRQANASTANQLDLVVGVSEHMVSASVSSLYRNPTGNVRATVGIGLDSTSALATGCLTNEGETAAANVNVPVAAHWKGYPGVGKHILVWLEQSAATDVSTWVGDGGAPTKVQSGIHGEVFA